MALPAMRMPPRDRVQPPAPGDDVGGYVLRARLGQGGFGTVYLAERGGQRYALKLLPLAGLGDWGERELLMLARVKHPNVVRLLGHWHWPDRAPCFLVVIMEYVEGRRLDVWAETENPSAHAVLLRVLGVTRALRALHEGRTLHRDVKEANVLVREVDGEAVLVDLGVGRCEDTSHVTGGSLPPGTRAYLSPEAWRFHRERPGEDYRSTAADDVYALGVVLYWLLTGRKPFHVGDEGVARSRPLVAPHVRDGRVPEALSALCLRLLEEQPEHRPDAETVVSQVEELLTRDTPEWHVPLCDFHDAHNVTTRPGPDADEEVGWFNAVREDLPPRRGPRWPRPGAESEPAVPASSMVSGPKGRRFPWTVTVVALLAVLGPRSPAPGWKVASPGQPPESHGAAVSTPAAIAIPAVTPKEPAPVTTQNLAGMPRQPTQPTSGRGPTGKTLKVAATACTLLGCPGAQVRERPPPEPCPPGALETMKQFDIDVGDSEGWSFGGSGNRYLTVSEGWTTVIIAGADFGDIPNGSTASGRLVFGDRVYGRITQVTLEGTGRTVPVCMELLDTDYSRGLVIEPGSTPTTARIFSAGYIKAVSSFK
jgi:serine/threonine protein kinase